MLTDVVIRNAKPADKQCKLWDAAGLLLLVRPNGKKLWRLRYQFGGRENSLALGHYPRIKLTEPRDRP